MNPIERKQQLITQGALYRAHTVLARESLREGLRPQALAKEAVPGIAAAVLSAYLGSGAAAALAGKLPILLPLVLRAFSAMAGRKGMRNTAVRLAVFGALAGAGYLYLKRKQR